MKFPICLIAVVAGMVFAAVPGLAQDVSPESKKSLELVRKHIDGLENGKGAGEVTMQTAPVVKQAFSDYDMVIVRFRLYPVARIMPEGLHASNIYAVDKQGKIEN